MKRAVLWLLALLLALPGAAAAQKDEADEARRIVTLLLRGDTDAVYARFADAMRQAMSAEQLALVPAQLQAMAGEFVGFGRSQALGTTVVQVVEMSGMNLLAQVSFTPEGQVQGLAFVPQQKPKPEPPADNEEAVLVGPYDLPGVLTLPDGEGPFPAAVLVHGSGPNDRNETNGNTAIFRDLAQALSRQGIAVLRYDKRTYQVNQGALSLTQAEIDNMTVYEETMEDAVAAVRLLREDARIDAGRVFIVGHSLGGMLAGQIETAGAGARGLVLLAGTLRPLCEVMADQLEALGGDMAEEAALARALSDMDEAQARQVTLLGVNGYYYWDEARRDREDAFVRAGLPMLVLQGGQDRQVYADRDFPLWQAFAQAQPDMDVTLRLYEALGHSFTSGDALDPRVSEEIAGWMLSYGPAEEEEEEEE